ncbi:WRKY DNA-binding transcription factor 70-like isoform X2 [Carex rostrata]
MAENSVIGLLREGQESTEKLKVLLVQHKLPREVVSLLENISGVFTQAVAMSQNVVASPEPLPTRDENVMYTNSSKKRRTQVAPKFGGRKRSYFRCTHKYDEHCQATRQVQQSEQQPGKYEITYIGEHTCKQAKKHCQEQDQSYIINFKSNTNNQIKQFSSPPISSLIKHEHEEEVMSNQTSSDNFTTSPEQVITSSDFWGLELESIASDSLSLEFDGASLEFENMESILSYDHEFGSLFQ